MKIRQGFVSNSSSSSYIIEFNQPIDSKILSKFSQLTSIQSRIDRFKDNIQWTVDYLNKKGLKDQILEDEDVASWKEDIVQLESKIHNSVIFTCERGNEIDDLLDFMIEIGVITRYESEEY